MRNLFKKKQSFTMKLRKPFVFCNLSLSSKTLKIVKHETWLASAPEEVFNGSNKKNVL